ncbi:hypothetical protein [Desulfohalovibrio reitneri]|uniref:hypothetical protein n=1 Tax=Desulfohalovibrio reitneri TaxID=1307759 RepID=UPI0004A772B3|nr:hypothetical protein [Desulfohalovibrio reitneri]
MKKTIVGLVCVMLLGGALAANGQELPETTSGATVVFSDPTPSESRRLTTSLGAGYMGEASFGSSDGGVELYRTVLSAAYSIFHLRYEYSDFVWNDLEALPLDAEGEAPWEGLHDISLSALLERGDWNRWSWWINAEATSSFEREFPGAVGVGASGELAFDVWKGWKLGLMLSTVVLSPLNQDLFGRLDADLALHVSPEHLDLALRELGLKGEEGEETRIGFRAGLSTRSRTYRLASDSPVFGSGYAGIRSLTAGAYMDYKVTENLTVSLGPEYSFLRSYSTYKDTGSLETSEDLGDAFGGFVGVSWRF